MAKSAYIKGFDKVKANLRKALTQVKAGSRQGLYEATILIRRDMDMTPPLIPVDTGNLRASWFVSPVGDNVLKIGFSANYAFFVHEMIGAKESSFESFLSASAGTQSFKKVNWSRPGSGPKFFESALKRNEKEILILIAKNAKL